MQDFRNLKIWQRSHELVLLTYRLTANFPKDEIFGLRHSMRKTAVDTAAFVAEGSSKGDDLEFARSVGASIALASKLEYYALVAADLEFMSRETLENYEKEIVETQKDDAGISTPPHFCRLASSFPKNSLILLFSIQRTTTTRSFSGSQ